MPKHIFYIHKQRDSTYEHFHFPSQLTLDTPQLLQGISYFAGSEPTHSYISPSNTVTKNSFTKQLTDTWPKSKIVEDYSPK